MSLKSKHLALKIGTTILLILGIIFSLSRHGDQAALVYVFAALLLTIRVNMLNTETGKWKNELSQATLRLHWHGDQIDLRRLTRHADRFAYAMRNHPAGKGL